MQIARLALLVGRLSTIVPAQAQAPRLLLQGAQCLAAKKFLPPSGGSAASFGYVVDAKSYPGQKVLYVVDYAGPGASEGLVFAIVLTETDGRQILNVQNNARFVRSKDATGGIGFPDPPLGGIWTQQHLVSAIKQIARQPRLTIPVNDLAKLPATGQCESYTDRK